MAEDLKEKARESAGTVSPSSGAWVRGLHLLALTGFALAQPLFDVLGRDAAFFVVRRSQPLDIWLLAGALALGLPLALWLVERLVGVFSRALESALHLVLVSILAALTLAPLAKRSIHAGDGVILAVIAAAAVVFALLYVRSGGLRSFLSVLSPAALVFAGVFLFNPSVRRVRDPQGAGRAVAGVEAETTVAFLILDELPLSSLLDEQLQFEALFPNFARLAGESWWFRNATASHVQTTTVVPALLSGKMPQLGLLPFAADHPDSIFTLLGSSHRLRVKETVTGVCPEELTGEVIQVDPFEARMRSLWDDLSVVYQHIVGPPAFVETLPTVSGVWGNFRAEMPDFGDASLGDILRDLRGAAVQAGRVQLLREFLETIDTETQPTLYFTHAVLPHKPWVLLPSGRQYLTDNRSPGNVNSVWSRDEGLTALAYQRHLLQLGYVDVLLGEFLDRLQEQGVYDRSLVVVLADHGVAFVPGQHARRPVPETVGDVLYTPLFVKLPFQEEARVSDRNVESIDVLPTIAGVLGIEIPWEAEGSSAVDPAAPERPEKRAFSNDTKKPMILDAAFPGYFATIERKNRLFGRDRDWDSIYSMGSRREWIGRDVSSMKVGPPADASAHIGQLAAFAAIDLESGVVPNFLRGYLTSDDLRLLGADILVAVNGVLSAQLTTYNPREGRVELAGILPDQVLRNGSNSVELFAVQADDSLVLVSTLTYRLVADEEGERIVSSDGVVYPFVDGGGMDGRLDLAEVEDGGIRILGWAGDREARRKADAVLLMLEEGRRVVPAQLGRVRRSFPEGSPLRTCGYTAFLPLDLFEGGEPRGMLRAVALSDGRAVELRLGGAARWLRK